MPAEVLDGGDPLGGRAAEPVGQVAQHGPGIPQRMPRHYPGDFHGIHFTTFENDGVWSLSGAGLESAAMAQFDGVNSAIVPSR